MITTKLSAAGCSVQHACGDSDVSISGTAANKAMCKATCLVWNDTDLLVLLIHYGNAETQNLYLKTESRDWDVNHTRQTLGDIFKHILFLHAFFGCDTTSTLYGVGKQVALTLNTSDS